jgi:serine/threonine protein kinase
MQRMKCLYERKQELGDGVSATVILGEDILTKEQVALKIPKEGYAEALIEESKLQKTLLHPNILKCAPQTDAKDETILVLELAHAKTVMGTVQEKGGLSLVLVHYLLLGMVSALEYLQERGIAHLDIKLENMLWGLDFKPKLADFGLAMAYSKVKPSLAVWRGTKGFRAPEVEQILIYDPRPADIWSLGASLMGAATGLRPVFEGALPSDVLLKLLNGTVADQERYFQAFGKSLPKSFQTLITGMLAIDPAKRWTLQDVKKSEFYRSPQGGPEEIQELLIAALR